MKNKLQPTRTTFSRNVQCKKAPRWLSKFFHFGAHNREEQLKKAPCMTKFCWYNTTKTGTEKYISFFFEMAFKSKQNSKPTSSLCHPILCDFNFNWLLSIIKSGTGFNILPPALLSLPSPSTSCTNHSLNFALFKLHFSNDS